MAQSLVFEILFCLLLMKMKPLPLMEESSYFKKYNSFIGLYLNATIFTSLKAKFSGFVNSQGCLILTIIYFKDVFITLKRNCAPNGSHSSFLPSPGLWQPLI